MNIYADRGEDKNVISPQTRFHITTRSDSSRTHVLSLALGPWTSSPVEAHSSLRGVKGMCATVEKNTVKIKQSGEFFPPPLPKWTFDVSTADEVQVQDGECPL